MTVYHPGQRVALVHTDDPDTRLRPGDTGTVRRHDQRQNTVHIDWDTGSCLSICLDAGDRIELLDPATPDVPESSPGAATWAATLERLRADGAEAGRGVAEQWAQRTIAAGVLGDVRGTARQILAGITDRDPVFLEALPRFTPPIRWHDGRDVAEIRYAEAAQHRAPRWRDLTAGQRAATIATSREAFDAAVVERVTELCHLAASPTGTDVSHPHPTTLGSAVYRRLWFDLHATVLHAEYALIRAAHGPAQPCRAEPALILRSDRSPLLSSNGIPTLRATPGVPARHIDHLDTTGQPGATPEASGAGSYRLPLRTRSPLTGAPLRDELRRGAHAGDIWFTVDVDLAGLRAVATHAGRDLPDGDDVADGTTWCDAALTADGLGTYPGQTCAGYRRHGTILALI